MENELEAAALAALSSKEIIKTTISDYESKLRESDRSPYLKCKKLYAQELEKWKQMSQHKNGGYNMQSCHRH
jgi:hypothetical protein